MSGLKTLRKEKGWTQPRLAKEVGVSQASVSYWERNNLVPPEYLHRVSEALGVTPERLEFVESTESSFEEPGYRETQEFLGEALKAIRVSKGYSQVVIAEGCGVSIPAVSNWERGNLPADQISAVTAVLGITERELRAKAGELMRQESVNSKQRVQIWQDTLLFDNELDPVAKAMLAAFPYFWNDAIKAVIVSPEKYVERAGWVDDYDINEAWEKVLESGYLEPVDSGAGIFKLVFRKG